MKFAVIGLGQFGIQLALELAGLDHEVLAIDRSEKLIDEVKNSVDFAVIADASDPKALRQLDLDHLDAVIVAVGDDFASSLLITAHLQELGVQRILCRVLNSTHERILRLMGVTEFIQPEMLAARQQAKRLGIRGATRHFGLTDEHAIVELEAPAFLHGQTLAQADLRQRFAVNLVTVRRGPGPDESRVLGVPTPDLRFEPGDALVVFGHEAAIKAFSQHKR